MKRVLISAIAALALALVPAPVAQADHCAASDPCGEFDWRSPITTPSSAERHRLPGRGVQHPTDEPGQLGLCREAVTEGHPDCCSRAGTPKQQGRMLTDAEVDAVINAAYDVCPEARP